MATVFKTSTQYVYAYNVTTDTHRAGFWMVVSNGVWYCRDRIRANLGLPQGREVFCYDQQGQPIEDFSNLKNNAQILVTEDYFEDPLVDAAGSTVQLQEGQARRSWMNAERSEAVTAAVISGSPIPPPSPSRLYLTLPEELASQRLATITAPQLVSAFTTVNPQSPVATLQATILECWGRTVETFLGPVGFMSPAEAIPSWDSKLLPMLALLAEVTLGQPDEARSRVLEAIKARSSADRMVTVADLANVIHGLYA